jgi:hypothetical protein
MVLIPLSLRSSNIRVPAASSTMLRISCGRMFKTLNRNEAIGVGFALVIFLCRITKLGLLILSCQNCPGRVIQTLIQRSIRMSIQRVRIDAESIKTQNRSESLLLLRRSNNIEASTVIALKQASQPVIWGTT